MPTEEHQALVCGGRALVIVNFLPVPPTATDSRRASPTLPRAHLTDAAPLSVSATPLAELATTLRDASQRATQGHTVVFNCAFTA
jgi:hypothetical protein